MDDTKYTRITVLTHAAVAISMGWVSFQLSPTISKYFVVLLGIILLFVIGFSLEKFVGKKGVRFWISNGVFIYLFFWAVSWTVFFNLA